MIKRLFSSTQIRSDAEKCGRTAFEVPLLAFALCLHAATAHAQMGGMGGMGGGGPGGGAQAEPAKARFRDHIHESNGLTLNREIGDKVIASVRIVGNRRLSDHHIAQKLQTRPGRFYDEATTLADVSTLHQMGAFDSVEFDPRDAPEGVHVTFTVRERAVVTEVHYHGNLRMNDRELNGRAGVNPDDPLSPFAIESATRRLIDYYHEKGFNRVAIESQMTDDGVVSFRINEGPLERIWKIRITSPALDAGNSIVSESRLKKIIKSRDARFGATAYLFNKADLEQIERDVDLLQQYYHNLGFLTATVGRTIRYDESGKWLDLTFVINEGPRFQIGDIQVVGATYMTAESIKARMELKPGQFFDGTKMRKDVGQIVYGYGEYGFIYADISPKTILRDESGVVDLVYEVDEGERFRISEIHVNIDGESQLMKESTILNLMELREGDIIDRRKLESDRRRLGASPLLEADPNVANGPDIKVIPSEDLR